MECEICPQDPLKQPEDELDTIVILPLRRDDGSLITLSCLGHARKLGLYCERHRRPHQGFENGTTACLLCIETKVLEFAHLAVRYLDQLEESLRSDEYERLLDWASFLAHATGHTEEILILRAIVTAATCNKKSISQIMRDAVGSGSAEEILPTSVTKVVLANK